MIAPVLLKAILAVPDAAFEANSPPDAVKAIPQVPEADEIRPPRPDSENVTVPVPAAALPSAPEPTPPNVMNTEFCPEMAPDFCGSNHAFPAYVPSGTEYRERAVVR
ncbi:MAG: hypothetical protein BWY06_03304 [Candidatus Latescibacteria bacterium ADurb.Bin168]|nr:MAG: hypothetical protein BWY06_03304 [Candidatus Latescibacteria bacterium ADurb.Bin168]